MLITDVPCCSMLIMPAPSMPLRAGISLGMRPANRRHSYNITTPPIDWVHTLTVRGRSKQGCTEWGFGNTSSPKAEAYVPINWQISIFNWKCLTNIAQIWVVCDRFVHRMILTIHINDAKKLCYKPKAGPGNLGPNVVVNVPQAENKIVQPCI